MACKGGECDCDRRLVRGLQGRTKKLAVAGCSKFGVSTVSISDLLEMDGFCMCGLKCVLRAFKSRNQQKLTGIYAPPTSIAIGRCS